MNQIGSWRDAAGGGRIRCWWSSTSHFIGSSATCWCCFVLWADEWSEKCFVSRKSAWYTMWCWIFYDSQWMTNEIAGKGDTWRAMPTSISPRTRVQPTPIKITRDDYARVQPNKHQQSPSLERERIIARSPLPSPSLAIAIIAEDDYLRTWIRFAFLFHFPSRRFTPRELN